jgi:hypothetical protein
VILRITDAAANAAAWAMAVDADSNELHFFPLLWFQSL